MASYALVNASPLNVVKRIRVTSLSTGKNSLTFGPTQGVPMDPNIVPNSDNVVVRRAVGANVVTANLDAASVQRDATDATNQTWLLDVYCSTPAPTSIDIDVTP